MMKILNVRTEVESLQVEYPHLELIPLKKYSDGDVKTDSWQDVFLFIRPPDYFAIDRENAPLLVRLMRGSVFSVSLTSASVNSRHASKLLLKETPLYS